jgi:regulator of cell morphogenesis and NO signaling
MILSQKPLREIAAEVPAAVPLFARFDIDLCRFGERSLAEACAHLNLSLDQLQEKLVALHGFSSAEADAHAIPLAQLIQRIVRVHHRRVRQDLAALAEMAARLEQEHSGRSPELAPLARLIGELHREMFDHIGREEQVLFPFIVRMEEEAALRYPSDHSCLRSLRTPIARMMQDHCSAEEVLEELRQRTNDFTPPQESCATKRAVFAGLRTFGSDLREHLRLEDEVLFPRALKLEAELSAGRPS